MVLLLLSEAAKEKLGAEGADLENTETGESWEELARSQAAAANGRELLDFGDQDGLAPGDIIALLDRTDAGAPFDRKVFVMVATDAHVLIFDQCGTPLDEPEAATPAGVQLFRAQHGDNSFETDCSSGDDSFTFYRVPDVSRADDGAAAGEAETADTAPSTSSPSPVASPSPCQGPHGGRESDDEGKSLEELVAEQRQLEQDAASDPPASNAASTTPASKPTLEQVQEFCARIRTGTRLLLPLAAGPGAESIEVPGTVALVKGSPDGRVIIVVHDNLSYQRVVLTEECGRALLNAKALLLPADDKPPTEHTVGILLARDYIRAEGFFWDGGVRESLGANVVVARNYMAAAYDGISRFPADIPWGSVVSVCSREGSYRLLRIIINAEEGAVSTSALLGDESSLVASPTLIPRYFVVPFCKRQQANLMLVEPLDPDGEPPPALVRLESGVLGWLDRSFSLRNLKKGDYDVPPPEAKVPPPPLTSVSLFFFELWTLYFRGIPAVSLSYLMANRMSGGGVVMWIRP